MISKIRQKAKKLSKNIASEHDLVVSQLSKRIIELEYRVAKKPTEHDLKILIDSKDEIEQL